eukprot:181293_1
MATIRSPLLDKSVQPGVQIIGVKEETKQREINQFDTYKKLRSMDMNAKFITMYIDDEKQPYFFRGRFTKIDLKIELIEKLEILLHDTVLVSCERKKESHAISIDVVEWDKSLINPQLDSDDEWDSMSIDATQCDKTINNHNVSETETELGKNINVLNIPNKPPNEKAISIGATQWDKTKNNHQLELSTERDICYL